MGTEMKATCTYCNKNWTNMNYVAKAKKKEEKKPAFQFAQAPA
jgi:hypothetical protein